MAITTAVRSDTQIQADVLAELKWDARVQPNEVGVSVKDGIVTLTGYVDSYTKKWAAEERAHRQGNQRLPHVTNSKFDDHNRPRNQGTSYQGA